MLWQLSHCDTGRSIPRSQNSRIFGGTISRTVLRTLRTLRTPQMLLPENLKITVGQVWAASWSISHLNVESLACKAGCWSVFHLNLERQSLSKFWDAHYREEKLLLRS